MHLFLCGIFPIGADTQYVGAFITVCFFCPFLVGIQSIIWIQNFFKTTIILKKIWFLRFLISASLWKSGNSYLFSYILFLIHAINLIFQTQWKFCHSDSYNCSKRLVRWNTLALYFGNQRKNVLMYCFLPCTQYNSFIDFI